MALTVADVTNRPAATIVGGRVLKVVGITFDSSYPTGGEGLTAADLGLATIQYVKAHAASGYVFQYDYSGHKLLAYYGDNNNSGDGPLIEVPDTTDLSLIVTRALVIGEV